MILRLESGSRNWIEIDPIKRMQRYEIASLGIHSGGWSNMYTGINVYVESVYSNGWRSINMMSCCGGKGGERWDVDKSQWSCHDCGMAKSNDPNYLYQTPKATQPFEFEPDYHKRSGCDHQWVSYTGLKDQYEFCKLCDVKK